MKLLNIITISLFLCSCAKFNIHAPDRETKSFNAKWIKNLDPSYQSGNLPIGFGSPLIHDGMVYVGNNKGSLDAYSLDSGRLIWSQKTLGAMNSSPVVSGDLLIYGDGHGRVYARNLKSNSFKYKFDLGSPVESSPVVSNGRLFLHTRNHKIFCVDAMTGKILWSYKRSVPYFSTLQRTSRPLIISNRAYVGFADGYLVAFSVEEGQVIWEKKMSTSDKFVDVDMTPAYFRGKLIVSSINGKAEIIDPQSGLLHKRLSFSSNRDAVFFGNELFLGTTDGKLVSLDDSFTLKKDLQLSSNPISSISKWKSGLVVTTIGNEIFHLDSNLQVIEKFNLGTEFSAVFGHTSVENDALAILSSRNRLYLFK